MPNSPLAHLEGLLATPYVPQGSRPPRRDVFRFFSDLAVEFPGVYTLWVRSSLRLGALRPPR
jgi:hypothetical protein